MPMLYAISVIVNAVSIKSCCICGTFTTTFILLYQTNMRTEDKMFFGLSCLSHLATKQTWGKSEPFVFKALEQSVGQTKSSKQQLFFSFLFISMYLGLCLIGNIDGENMLFQVNREEIAFY